ncbi:NHL domain-containing protein [Undibacterium terreum]|uniref:NHL domain-containing protein n=1 Tax=Undibacterium terreum TaxID=1224302 RepID=UPI0016649ABA|nr:hypothetical protein [Undibacterium terreum]
MSARRFISITASCLTLSLSACGGGGSSTSATVPSGPVTVVDTKAPVVVAPIALTILLAAGETAVSATDPRLANFMHGAIASDDVGVVGGVSNDAPPSFTVGDTPVTFSAKDAAGNVGVAAAVVTVVDSGPQLRLLAGDLCGWGNLNGMGKSARFGGISVATVDLSGTIYIAETVNIRKINAAGVTSLFVGSTSRQSMTDGNGTAAGFVQIFDMSTDAAGNLYVSDSNAIRKVTPAGVVTTIAAGVATQTILDGPLGIAKFKYIYGVASDAAGNIYFTDYDAIRKISVDGKVTTLFKNSGFRLAVDGAGNVYVPGNPVSRMAPNGTTTSLSVSGDKLGMDGLGNVLINDTNASLIYKVTPAGVVSTAFPLIETSLSQLLVDAQGNLVTWDNGVVKKINPSGQASDFAGCATAPGAPFRSLAGLALDGHGSVYVGDTANDVIQKISATGTISLLAGSSRHDEVQTDGTGAAANFSSPQAMVVDSLGNLFVSDYLLIGGTSHYQKIVGNTIRKITPTGVVTTFAGKQVTSSVGISDFNMPEGVALDPQGNLFVLNKGQGTINKVTPTGVISTLALHEPGNSTPVSLTYPKGIAIDAASNLYITDYNTVQKITPDGGVSLVAGYGPGFADGSGALARFNSPSGIAVDANGNLYVADTGNNAIRKITPTGIVSTMIGSPLAIGNKTGSLAAASVWQPVGIAWSASGLVITTPYAVLTVAP